MEVKDVNSLVNQVLSGNASLRNIAFDSAFSELIKEKSDETSKNKLVNAQETSSVTKAVKNQPEVKAVAKSKGSVSEEKTKRASMAEVNSQTTTKNEMKEKPAIQQTSEKAEKTEKVATTKEGKTSTSVEENNKTTVAETEKETADVSVEAQIVVPFVEAPVAQVSETVTQVEEPALDGVDQVDLVEVSIAKEGEVEVAENLAPKIDISSKSEANLEVDAKAVVQPELLSEDVEVAVELSKVAPKMTSDVSVPVENVVKAEAAPQALDAKEVLKKETVSADSKAVEQVEKVAVQAQKISEIVGSDKKLMVNVEVKEEKFSYLANKIVNNSVDVAKAVEAVASETSSEAPALDGGEVVSQSTTQSSAKTTPVATPTPVAAAVVNAPVNATQNSSTSDVLLASGAKVTENVVSNVSNTQVSGKILLNSELAGKEETKAGFKDVYKGMSKEVVDQVKVNITKSAVKGIDKINIQLKPEELGSIEVKMQIGKDGKISAHIVSAKAETLEILQKDVQSLEKAFNEAGFNTDSGSLTFSHRQQDETENRAQLKSFIGNHLERETEVANQDYSWNANGGLNIRV
ncbi:MAG: flagellar hook-length control protein FliK [Alphaproteobacteria bacterium]|nr:flagellar hook-length control protein FliK [Alphaproteobacteria bacterium]